MILTATPLRLSFFGGGSDYPAWFNKHGGQVLGATIDKYVYILYHAGHYRDVYDLPTGSGLATSSAHTVGLLKAISGLTNKEIASVATYWEQFKMGQNVGAQDQVLCSLGGFRKLIFDEHGVRDRLIEADGLSGYLMLFDTHQRRISGDVIASQLENLEHNESVLLRMMEMVDEGQAIIERGAWSEFGELLGESWVLKKQLSASVSTPAIDDIYSAAIKAGATGGKLLGAGGGGFILFFVPPDRQDNVRRALSDLTHVSFQFENRGTEIIYRD